MNPGKLGFGAPRSGSVTDHNKKGAHMHLSMHNWMRAEPLEVTLARLAKYGYESIEISGEPEQYKPDDVRPLLEKYNLRCWGSVTLMLGERNLVAGDEGQRRASVQYTKDCIDLVARAERRPR